MRHRRARRHLLTRWLPYAMVLLLALAATDQYFSEATAIEAISLRSDSLTQKENPTDIYYMYLRLADGRAVKVEVAEAVEFRAQARVRLLQRRGGLSGQLTYQFDRYID